MPTLLTILGFLAGGLIALGALLVGGMRAKWSPVIDRVRRMNRRFMNPSQMGTAGQPGAYAGILRHVGRNSGVSYETPVGIVPYQGGFVIAMVYGPRTDWARNVLQAGSAEIVLDGLIYEVSQPRIVTRDEVDEAFSPREHVYQRLFAIDAYLRLDAVGEPVASGAALNSDHD